jgi:predicted amidohydrolase
VTPRTTIAVAALRIEERNVDANAARCHQALAVAASAGAALLVLPECALTGYRYDSADDTRNAAIPPDHARLADLAAAAVEAGTTVVVGFLERVGTTVRNCAAVLGADGRVHLVHKTHLPLLGADRFVESGARLGPVVDTPFGRLGVVICYDLRFPETCRALALAGAEVVAVPVNWSTDVGTYAEHVVATRAIENRVFVAVADRSGAVEDVEHLAASQIVDLNGVRVTAPVATTDDVAVLVSTVDLSSARRKSTAFTSGTFEIDVFADRRPELYGALTQEQPTDA